MATVKKMKRPERMYAFNTTWLLWLAIFGVSLWGDIYLAVQEKKFSWVLALITLAVAIALFVDSLYYCFAKAFKPESDFEIQIFC